MIRRLGSARSLGNDLRESAAHWVMLEEHGRLGPEEAARRDEWLAEHPSHVVAYDKTRHGMRRLDAMAADPRILALRASALSTKPKSHAPAWSLAASIACGFVLAGGAAATIGLDRAGAPVVAALEQIVHPGAPVYRTAVGERSTITLQDGSVVTLNTDTVLRVAFTSQARGVRLVRGQALFEVAHGKKTPFQVYAGDRVVTAVGTVFDVRLQGQAVKVALVEGKVRVGAKTGSTPVKPKAEVMMSAGEVLEARPARPMRVQYVDVRRETSWRSGMLTFDETPLAEAVAELNRYSTQRLVIEDPSIAGLHVTGGFKTGDMDRFARTVEEILPVDRVTDADGTVRLSARAKTISSAG